MNLFGLNLCEEDAFTGKEIYGNRYEQNRIIDFFELLEVESGSTNPTKDKGFFNAHLRAEQCKRMAAAGYLNPLVGVAKLGNITAIKTMRTSAMQRTATNAMEIYRDLYAKADDTLTDQQSRGKGFWLVSPSTHIPPLKICF